MQSSQIIDIVSSYPSIKNNFAGVFSINTIPKTIKVQNFLISNTQNSTEPGQHWFCIFRNNRSRYEYFDSLGVNEEKLNLISTLKVFPKNSIVNFNETAFQKSNSSTCGLFVLYFIIHRMHNLDISFYDLLSEIFVIDCNENESKVCKFSEENF